MIKPSTIFLAAVLLLGPLVAAELAVRALIESGRLPYASTSSEAADIGFANLARLGRPDVLVLGTSSIRNALHPDTLERLASEELGRPVRVQSVAQGGLSLADQQLIVESLSEQDLLPEALILGLSPSTITGQGLTNRWFSNSELGQAWSGCADLDEPEASICRLGQQSALWRWRGRPKRLIEAVAEPMPTTLRSGQRILHEDGWTSEPGASAKRFERMLKGYVERFPEGVPQAAGMSAAFAQLIAALRDRGTTVIPTALPYAPPLEEALVERNPAWRQELAAGYDGLVEAAGIDIVRVHRFGDWWRPRSSNDPRHLSAEGAAALTEQLWTMPEFREPLLESLRSDG